MGTMLCSHNLRHQYQGDTLGKAIVDCYKNAKLT